MPLVIHRAEQQKLIWDEVFSQSELVVGELPPVELCLCCEDSESLVFIVGIQGSSVGCEVVGDFASALGDIVQDQSFKVIAIHLQFLESALAMLRQKGVLRVDLIDLNPLRLFKSAQPRYQFKKR